jgi:hypothetical protein
MLSLVKWGTLFKIPFLRHLVCSNWPARGSVNVCGCRPYHQHYLSLDATVKESLLLQIQALIISPQALRLLSHNERGGIGAHF